MYEITSSISSTTVNLLGSVGGGSNLGLFRFLLSTACVRCALLLSDGVRVVVLVVMVVDFLLKKEWVMDCRSLFLFMNCIKLNQVLLDYTSRKTNGN